MKGFDDRTKARVEEGFKRFGVKRIISMFSAAFDVYEKFGEFPHCRF